MNTGTTHLELRGLRKSYGAVPVLKDVSFDIREGEFVCLLGPSGCGKTTLLMCLAGLEGVSGGDILRQGTSILDRPPSERDVGIVFQSYALFPNLSVRANIGFGLVSQRRPTGEIEQVVSGLLDTFSLQGHADKYPSQLSGGQQQRVALARALALKPSLLLLDEPLSALDAVVRQRLRQELRDLQSRLGLTTVMVTHDQEEAQSLADRIVLMREGQVAQIGTPWEIYNQPASAFAADFIGAGNLYAGVTEADGVRCGEVRVRCAMAGEPARAVQVLLRPEDVTLRAESTPDAFAQVQVDRVEHLGPVARVHLRLPDGDRLLADVGKRDLLARAALQPGARLWASVDPASVRVLAA